jgi:tetratricopeptide (TPR) repeat protein
MRVLLLMLLIPALLPAQDAENPAADSQAARPVAELQKEGVEALDAQQYERAAELFRAAVQAEPGDYSSHFHLALACTYLDRTAEAIEGFERTLELEPDLYQAHLYLGILLNGRQRSEEAIPHLEAAVKAKPAELRPHLALGEAYAGAGRFEDAEKQFSEAVILDADSAAAHHGRGQARARQEKFTEAAADYRKAAELEPALRESLLELGEQLEGKGRLEEAVAIYLEFPEQVAVRERVGQLYLTLGKPAEAIRHLEWAATRSPSAANRVALATAYLRAGFPEKSVAEIEAALALEPGNPQLHLMRGRLLRDQRQFEAAAAAFFDALRRDAGLTEGWSELAAILVMLEDYPKALGAIDQLEKLNGLKPGHWFLRAIVFDKMQAYDRALPNYKRFLELSTGGSPDEEFQARQRVRIIERILEKRR